MAFFEELSRKAKVHRVYLKVAQPNERAVRLYEKCGFAQSSWEFLEDGIPHIEMTWTRKN